MERDVEVGIIDPLGAVVGSVEVEVGRDELSMGTVEAVDEKKVEAVELERLSRYGAGWGGRVPAATDWVVDCAAGAPGAPLGRRALFVVGEVGACMVRLADVADN